MTNWLASWASWSRLRGEFGVGHLLGSLGQAVGPLLIGRLLGGGERPRCALGVDERGGLLKFNISITGLHFSGALSKNVVQTANPAATTITLMVRIGESNSGGGVS